MTAPAFVRIDPKLSAPPPPLLIRGNKLRFTSPGYGPAKRNVLIIGCQTAGRELASYLRQHPAMGCEVRGFLDDLEAIGGDVLGRVNDLAGVARAQFVDEIIMTAPYQREQVSQVVLEAQKSRVALKIMPDLLGLGPELVLLDKMGDLPVLSLHREHSPVFPLFSKRAADIALSATLLCLTSPALAAIALLIRLDSPGPVLYRGQRVGKKGRPFLCCKFRTMIGNADQIKDSLRRQNEREGPTFKLTRDPRVTRAGRFLRRYSLDELPQLWNVLRGEMSLVGPRPHPLDDFERYAIDHFRRLDVTPGITGLWQVTARNDPSFHRNLKLDVEYIERWSFWLDVRILFQTVAAVLRGSGT